MSPPPRAVEGSFSGELQSTHPLKNTQCVVLAGNPNVGKSAVFNALTGLKAEVSNYPGTTIDVSKGKFGEHQLIDTPGVYGVSSFNDEERIARGYIVDAGTVVNVVSALSLDRDLFLTLQLIAMGKPMIIAINQWDEARTYGLQIDTERLAEILGVPIVSTVAVRNEGIEKIVKALPQARSGYVDEYTQTLLEQHRQPECAQHHLLLALEGDVESQTIAATIPNLRAGIYRNRRATVDKIFAQVVQQSPASQTLGTRLGRTLLHPVYGSSVALLVCYLLFYQLLGVFVAGTVVNYTEKDGLRMYYEPSIRRLAATVFPTQITASGKVFEFPSGTLSNERSATELAQETSKLSPVDVRYDFWHYRTILAAVGNILVGEYGILTLTVTYLLGLLLPLVLSFYLGLSLLEDSGYLPRLAVIVDRWLNKIGLNGRAIIPLILGLGCVTMATVTTRLLTTTREKIIATALLGIAIPCSAQLGIVSGTLAHAGGLLPWLVYGTVVGGMLGLTGLLLHKLLPGKSQPLMIDLPPMRLPRARNVLGKTWTKSWNFMMESIPMFCVAGLVVTIAQITGALDLIITFLKPLTVSLLKLPDDPRISTTFILGIVRRDFAAFGLTDVALTAQQAVVAMIVITLFVPCIATVGVMVKERGLKIAMAIWLGSWLCAFAVGGILARILTPLFNLAGQ